MKIIEATEKAIYFNNRIKLTYCLDFQKFSRLKQNLPYAKFEEIKKIPNYDNVHLNEKKLHFKRVEGKGFYLKDDENEFFIPCYYPLGSKTKELNVFLLDSRDGKELDAFTIECEKEPRWII